MENARIVVCYVFLICIFSKIHSLTGKIGEYDDYLRKQEAEARQESLKAYNPDVDQTIKHSDNNDPSMPLNGTITIKGGDKADGNMTAADGNTTEADGNTTAADGNTTATTRRGLRGRGNWKKMKGPCTATNPIDKCWRCQANWAANRKKLASCVRGFGHKTTGGLAGKFYTVTEPTDDDVQSPKPGTIRHAVIQKGPLWIIFARSMHIKLKQELMVTSHKTIDARGADVHIAFGAGITIQFAKNVIIHGLHIHHIVPSDGGMIRDSADHIGIRTKADGDGISIFTSSNIWLDHLSMSRCQDGLIDAIQGSTAITISNGHFTHHNDVILLGASDQYAGDSIMQVTVAYNHFGKGLVQRMPRIRWGFVHVVNNDYTHWEMYAIGGSRNPTILSQGNRFIAPPHLPFAKEVTKRDYAQPSEWKKWTWMSEKDLFMNGAFFVESGDQKFKHKFTRKEIIRAKHGIVASKLTRYAGALHCFVGKPC